MGEVIRKNASVQDIFADVDTTLANARAKGGIWKERAEEQLGTVAVSIDGIETRMSEAASAMLPLQAEVDSKKDQADALLGRASDEIWNVVGRPRTDPALTMLFPGGIAHYTSGSVHDQPGRMDLLAELLESGLHPRLPADQAATHAGVIRAGAAALRAAVDAASAPRAKVQLIERVRRTIATGAQVELANLKRLYKAEHFSEADIHAVIPARVHVRRRAVTGTGPSPAAGTVPASMAAPPAAPRAPESAATLASNGV